MFILIKGNDEIIQSDNINILQTVKDDIKNSAIIQSNHDSITAEYTSTIAQANIAVRCYNDFNRSWHFNESQRFGEINEEEDNELNSIISSLSSDNEDIMESNHIMNTY